METSVTFVTLAQNSAQYIEGCVRSCQGLGKHLVVDGGSSDSTSAIAQRLGATVIYRPYDYAANQYNHAFDSVDTPWAFVIDSDERLSPELKAELRSLDDHSTYAGYHVPRRNYFLRKQIRYSGWWPDYNVRLLKVNLCRYDDREIHARIVTQGALGTLKGPLVHHTYSSVSQYISKLNSYTDREIEARRKAQTISDDRSKLRAIWLKTPGRPFSRFLYMYFVRRGVLDGRHGLHLAVLSAFYEYVTSLKSRYDK